MNRIFLLLPSEVLSMFLCVQSSRVQQIDFSSYCSTSTPSSSVRLAVVTWGWLVETALYGGDGEIKSTPTCLKGWGISSHFISSDHLSCPISSLYQAHINILVNLVFTSLRCSTFRPHFWESSFERISDAISWKEHNYSHGIYSNRSKMDMMHNGIYLWNTWSIHMNIKSLKYPITSTHTPIQEHSDWNKSCYDEKS